MVQVKNDKVGLFAKSGLKALETLQSVFQDSNVGLYSKCLSFFEYRLAYNIINQLDK